MLNNSNNKSNKRNKLVSAYQSWFPVLYSAVAAQTEREALGFSGVRHRAVDDMQNSTF